MASSYRIPIQIGYSEDLSFRIAPVTKAILNADADWQFTHELCLDAKAAEALILPFISQRLKKDFVAHDEINILSFAAARRVCRDLKITAAMIKDDYDNPALNDLKAQVTPDMILPEDKRGEAVSASPEKIEKLRRENFSSVVDFYNETADKMNMIMDSYSKKGYLHFAVCMA